MRRSILLSTLFLVTVITGCSRKTDEGPESVAGDPLAFVKDDAATAGTRDMKLNLPVSAVYRYKAEQREELVQDDSMSVTSVTTAYYTKKVTANSAGIISFTVRYDSIMETQVGKGMGTDDKTVRYRSTDSADGKNPKYAVVNSLIGKEVTITITERGKIQEISGLAGIVQDLSTRSPRPLDDTTRMQVAEQIKQVYYMQLVSQEHSSMPDAPLDSTRSWSKDVVQQLPPVFLARSTMKYTVAGVGTRADRKVGKVDAVLNGTIGLVTDKIPVTVSRGVITGKGSALVDLQTGHTLHKVTSIRQELTAGAPNPQTKKQETMKQVKSSSLTVVLL
ncbi:MAG: DUF6263 family protein [Candidatus Kapaibacterium sp.]